MSSTTGFLGMRGTGDWTNEERPKSFREGILRLYPNGMMPLTAITSKGKNQKVDDPEFKWYEKELAVQGGQAGTWSGTTATAGTAMFKNAALSTAYGSGDSAVATALVYVKVASTVVTHFRPGHLVVLVDSDDISKLSYGKVVSRSSNGASSYVEVRLLTASAAGYLYNANYIDIVGNANAEGGTIPDGVSYDPSKFYNYTGIMRTPLSITRTQQRTKMRTGNTYQELKREALEYHGIELEMAILFGERTENTGDNGQPERTSMGIRAFIRENAPDNIIDFRSDSEYTNYTWLQAGQKFINRKLEVLFRYGQRQKLALCGTGALLGIQELVEQSGQYRLESGMGSYGINVTKWITPFGEINLKTHPLFSLKSYMRNTMILLEPENIVTRVIDDTMFKEDPNMKKAGQVALDGIKEEFLTELGWEFHFAKTFMELNGVGQDGAAAA